MKDNLGLGPSGDILYLKLNGGQKLLEEISNHRKVLRTYLTQFCEKRNLSFEDIELEFINYGYTQLVYVLTVKGKERYTLLVKQPMVEQGKLQEEFQNLVELSRVDKNVVAPYEYRAYNNETWKGELFITPYMYQARCVASDTDWGMYIPEPEYRFEEFSMSQRFFVNVCMIAKLVYLYDEKNQKGIASAKLGGGDFILLKGWEDEEPCVKYTLDNLYLTAAREMVECSLDEYVEMLRDEFSRPTIQEDQSSLTINHRGRVAMAMEEIEEGIELGMNLRKRKEAIYPKTRR